MLHPVQRSTGLVAALAVVALVVAACGAGATSSGGAEGGAAAGASISFASPSDGASVSVPFDVQLTASVPLADPSTGEHHAHIYFDTGTDAADYDIVYGNTWTVTRQLSPGQHTLIVALANPDHSLAGPKQQITITVGAGNGGGAPAATPAATSAY
jgi:hypothetical protein